MRTTNRVHLQGYIIVSNQDMDTNNNDDNGSEDNHKHSVLNQYETFIVSKVN